MALNIKNVEVEELAKQVAGAAGVSKTEAIRQALLEKKDRLGLRSGKEQWEALRPMFERDIWAHIDPKVLGKGVSQEEQDEILGYGPEGF
jgi:antitoxin VapB